MYYMDEPYCGILFKTKDTLTKETNLKTRKLYKCES